MFLGKLIGFTVGKNIRCRLCHKICVKAKSVGGISDNAAATEKENESKFFPLSLLNEFRGVVDRFVIYLVLGDGGVVAKDHWNVMTIDIIHDQTENATTTT